MRGRIRGAVETGQRGRGRGRGRGGQESDVVMTASGAFALGPAVAGVHIIA